jgi:hypothetical protein
MTNLPGQEACAPPVIVTLPRYQGIRQVLVTKYAGPLTAQVEHAMPPGLTVSGRENSACTPTARAAAAQAGQRLAF